MAGGSGEVVVTPSGKQGGCCWGCGVSLLLRTETLSSSLPCSTHSHGAALGRLLGLSGPFIYCSNDDNRTDKAIAA